MMLAMRAEEFYEEPIQGRKKGSVMRDGSAIKKWSGKHILIRQVTDDFVEYFDPEDSRTHILSLSTFADIFGYIPRV